MQQWLLLRLQLPSQRICWLPLYGWIRVPAVALLIGNAGAGTEALWQNIGWMLENDFEDLPSRKRKAYAEAFAAYRRDVNRAVQDRKEYSDEPLMLDLDTLEYAHPVNLAFVCSRDSETGLPCFAERMTFERLSSFLYADFCKGLAAGNLFRRCTRCGR